MLKKYYLKNKLEVGCDEAGRGCLAGPVVAAAVIFPPKYKNHLIIDSKKLSETGRDLLRLEIEKKAITWGLGIVEHSQIDKINILNASILAMHKAIDNLKKIPQHIIVDGNKFKPYKKIPFTCIVKGDSKYISIAAASILAKTHRDEIMKELHSKFIGYNWKQNKGYPTKQHREAILKYGISNYHRKSFKLISPNDR